MVHFGDPEQIAVSALGLLAGEMVGVGRCRGLWLVKRRDKDLVGRLITLCCPLSLQRSVTALALSREPLACLTGLPLLLVAAAWCMALQ